MMKHFNLKEDSTWCFIHTYCIPFTADRPFPSWSPHPLPTKVRDYSPWLPASRAWRHRDTAIALIGSIWYPGGKHDRSGNNVGARTPPHSLRTLDSPEKISGFEFTVTLLWEAGGEHDRCRIKHRSVNTTQGVRPTGLRLVSLYDKYKTPACSSFTLKLVRSVKVQDCLNDEQLRTKGKLDLTRQPCGKAAEWMARGQTKPRQAGAAAQWVGRCQIKQSNQRRPTHPSIHRRPPRNTILRALSSYSWFLSDQTNSVSCTGYMSTPKFTTRR